MVVKDILESCADIDCKVRIIIEKTPNMDAADVVEVSNYHDAPAWTKLDDKIKKMEVFAGSPSMPFKFIREDPMKKPVLLIYAFPIWRCRVEDVTKHTICIEDVPSGVTGKLRIGRGEFGFGVTRNEMAANRGAIYYYLPENRDPTVLEFKNGKYVRGDNDGGLTAFAPFNLWRSIFGDNRFYETWADVKKAVVEAINNRKIYVNVPCIPDLIIEESCCIDD